MVSIQSCKISDKLLFKHNSREGARSKEASCRCLSGQSRLFCASHPLQAIDPSPGRGGTIVFAQVGTRVLGFSWQKSTFMKYLISAKWTMIVKNIAKTYRVSIGNPSVTVANEASSSSFPPIMPTSAVYDAIIKYSTGIN